MKSRMDRYRNIDNTDHEVYSRSNKNKNLYKNIGNNTSYTNFTDVSKIDAFSLDDARRNNNTREGYKTIREYGNVDRRPKAQKDLDEFNYLYKDHENRVYDINSVLEKARENRKDKDELEEKRKLKNTNYNILASLNKEELERYRKDKLERNKPDDSELRNLIDTITSKTLAGEISKETGVDLLSDLMATNVMDRVDPKEYEKKDKQETKKEEKEIELSNVVLDKEDISKINKAKNEIIDTTDDIMKDLDKSFYTKSMDLSDKDFDFDDEEYEESKVPLVIKLILLIILLAVLFVVTYFIIQKM